MLINNLDELLLYIDDDNNLYGQIEFSNDFNYKLMIDYLMNHQDNYKCGLFLAYCYESGVGVKNDKKKSFDLNKYYAEQGNNKAQYNLGLCYFSGGTVKLDYNEASKWFEKSAEQGNVNSMLNLGYINLKGLGVGQDFKESYKWYKKAAEHGNAKGQNVIGEYYYEGLGVKQDYSEAFNWFEKSAGQGNKSALNNIGNCYLKGLGVDQDYKKAFKCFEKSAELGNSAAMLNLGFCYYNGIGVDQDYKKAFKWYKKSSDRGNAKAQCNLGICYYYGEGVDEDKKNALYLLNEAYKNGFTQAQDFINFVEKEIYDNSGKSYSTSGYDCFICALNNDIYAREIFNKLANHSINTYFSINNNSFFDYWDKIEVVIKVSKIYVIILTYDSIGNEYIKKEISLILKETEKNNKYLQLYLIEDLSHSVDDIYNKLINDYEINELAKYKYLSSLDINLLLEVLNNSNDKFVFSKNNLTNKEIEILNNELDVKVDYIKIPEFVDVFISWNHANIDEKNNIKSILEKNSYNIWESDTSARGLLNDAVKEGIRRAKGYIILLSHQAFSSSYIPHEIDEIINSQKEKGINDLRNIKIYLLPDSTNSASDIINELKLQNNSFNKLIPLTVDFNYDSNNMNGLISFVDCIVKEDLFRQYRDSLRYLYDTIKFAMGDVIQNDDDGSLFGSIEFENGYINRDLYYNNEIKYTLNDVLKYNKKPILIYGGGGTGKTLYIQNMLRTNTDKNKLFFYLRCSDIRDTISTDTNLLKLIGDICLKDDKYKLIRNQLSNIINNEKLEFYIIIDALDEALEKAKTIVDVTMNFYNNCDNKDYIHIIFTSRNVDDYNHNIGALKLEIRQMNDEDISLLFDKIFERQVQLNKNKSRKIDSISKKSFMQTLKLLTDDIKKNPLLISNLIYIYFVTNKLYEKKYEIIDKSEELLISALENERLVNTNIFDVIHLTAREVLNRLAYDSCVLNEINALKLFEKYILEKNETMLNDGRYDVKKMDNVEIENNAKELYKYLHARRIITGNFISHEIYRSYFAASFIYDNIYEECTDDDLKINYINFKNGKKQFNKQLNYNLHNEEKSWPIVTVDLICKLDFELYSLNNKMDKYNLSYDTFDESLKEMLNKDGISENAYNALDDVIKKKLLYFYDFVQNHMSR